MRQLRRHRGTQPEETGRRAGRVREPVVQRASVEIDTAKLGLTDLIVRVERAGYGVATGEADLVIKRLDDDNDARRLENALRKLEGVLEVQVSYATEKARVRYVPTIISQAEIRRAVAARASRRWNWAAMPRTPRRPPARPRSTPSGVC